MTDYSRLDETTLRTMLEASSDLEERLQLRSILRRLKKHSNTISFSPTNRENIMSNNHNNVLSLTTRCELRNSGLKSSSGPNPIEILPRCNAVLEKNFLSPIVNCNKIKENGTDKDCNGRADRNVIQIIQNCSSGSDIGVTDFNRNCSVRSERNIRLPTENCKRTLGKTLSEPVASDDSKLAHSRLIIQQLLEPRLAAAAKHRQADDTTPLNTTSSVPEEYSKSSETRKGVVAPRSYVGNDEPMFTRTLCGMLSATPGETVVLECNVVARHQPMVLWYRNSQIVPLDGSRYEQSYDGDLARLAIRNMGQDVVGIFECAARNAFGKVTSTCQVQLRGYDRDRQESPSHEQMATPSTPRVTVRRSETLPSSAQALRVISSAARRKMEAGKPSLRQDPVRKNETDMTAVEVASHPEEVEEDAVARSTRTEKASDGGKVTTTTTVTTHKARDGSHLVTKQTKQITRVGGVGTTNYSINKCSAEEIADRLAGIFEKKALSGTSGVILVKTENWNSQDGITHRNEKSQIWEGPRLALSFNEADMASKYNNSDDTGLTPLQRSATTVKQRLLEWCRVTLKDYKHVRITNFSTSWNDGMAFCALVHHFIPDAFDYSQLDPKNRRENFQLAFETAEKRAGITPLLEVEDMVSITVPDWKCVFMYVQSIYREFVLPKPLQQRSPNSAD